MKLRCPECGSQISLPAAVEFSNAKHAVAAAARLPAQLSGPALQYVAMFRPQSKALAFSKARRLMEELADLIEAGQVRHNGITRPAPVAAWRQALETVLERRAAGSLKTPLKTHNYLISIVADAAETMDAKQEQQHEQQLRNRPAKAVDVYDMPGPLDDILQHTTNAMTEATKGGKNDD